MHRDTHRANVSTISAFFRRSGQCCPLSVHFGQQFGKFCQRLFKFSLNKCVYLVNKVCSCILTILRNVVKFVSNLVNNLDIFKRVCSQHCEFAKKVNTFVDALVNYGAPRGPYKTIPRLLFSLLFSRIMDGRNELGDRKSQLEIADLCDFPSIATRNAALICLVSEIARNFSGL